MGSLKFEVNLPSFFGKKTIANFNLDEKFFEFSDYFLIDDYSVNCVVEIEKKNVRKTFIKRFIKKSLSKREALILTYFKFLERPA